jgi:hypothetical protein
MLPIVVTSWLAGTSPSLAVSSKFKDVCASGCTYSSVQDAIDAISDSSSTNVYTIFVDAGVLTTSTGITTNGKSYINFIGRGMGASIVQATAGWFGASRNLLDLSDSTHIVVRGLTLDAKTNDDGSNSTSNNYTAVLTDDADAILFDSCEVMASTYAFWEASNSSGHHIELRNSVVRSAYYGLYLQTPASWHIYSSDIRAIRTGTGESVTTAAPAGIQISGGLDTKVTVWGSHVHAESSYAGMTGTGMSAVRGASVGAQFIAVGSTLHAKLLVNLDSSHNWFGIAALTLESFTSSPLFHVVGSDLLYETPTNLSYGRPCAIAYRGTGISTATFNLDNSHMVDLGGSGGGARSDILNTYPIEQTYQPRFRQAAVHSTQNPQKGTVTLSSGSSTVSLSPTQSDKYYTVLLTSSTQETLSVTSKSTTQFTISSSNGSSTAVVDYIVVR